MQDSYCNGSMNLSRLSVVWLQALTELYVPAIPYFLVFNGSALLQFLSYKIHLPAYASSLIGLVVA